VIRKPFNLQEILDWLDQTIRAGDARQRGGAEA